jgi:hypothetical protein
VEAFLLSGTKCIEHKRRQQNNTKQPSIITLLISIRAISTNQYRNASSPVTLYRQTPIPRILTVLDAKIKKDLPKEAFQMYLVD